MTFINRFIRENFPATRKVLPRNSQPVAVVARKTRNTEVDVVDSSTTEVKDAEQFFEDAREHSVFSAARQIFLKPKTQNHVFVRTRSRVLLTIEHRILRPSRQFALAA